MSERKHASSLIRNLVNNLITIGRLRGKTSMVDEHENFFVAEIMNELTHLPYDTFLIPLIKRLGAQTRAEHVTDVLHVGTWDLDESYLNPCRSGHIDGLSIQADATIVLSDCVVVFEFKRPHSVPSMNSITLKQLGRQVLLGEHLCSRFEVPRSNHILVCNTAPLVHIPHRGKVAPGKVVSEYFEDREDPWLRHESIRPLVSGIESDSLRSRFTVITWPDIIDEIRKTARAARDHYLDPGVRQLFNNALASMEDFYARRRSLLEN